MNKNIELTESEKLLLVDISFFGIDKENLNPSLKAKLSKIDRKLKYLRKQREGDLRLN